MSEEVGYTVGSWKGIVQYRCTKCAFDTVEGEQAMLEHIRKAHTPPPPPVVTLPLVDRYGNPIRAAIETSEQAGGEETPARKRGKA